VDNEKTAQLSDLLAKVAIRDQVAFKELYELSAAKLNGVAYRIVNSVDIANEITQEAFIQIWKNSTEYNSTLAQPMTWMTSIVRYRAYDYVRKESNRLERKMVDWGVEDLSKLSLVSENTYSKIENTDLLKNCLDVLNVEQHQSVLMAYYFGYSRDEISLKLQKSVDAVKSILRRGLARLQTCLDQ
jgi:RNA polymerase sigma-70 factor, ECF subfamily